MCQTPQTEPDGFSTTSGSIVFSLLQAEVRTRLCFFADNTYGNSKKTLIVFLQKKKSSEWEICLKFVFLSHGWPENSSEYLSLDLQLFNQACRNFNEGRGLFLCATRSTLNAGPVYQWEEQTDPDSTL